MGYVPVHPPSERVIGPDCILTWSPLPDHWFSTVSRIRWDAAEHATRIGEVRAHFAGAGVRAFTWWLGPSSPPGLADALRAGGAVPEPDGDRATAMVLDREPIGSMPDGVTVERVRTFEQFRTMQEILFELDDDTPKDHAAALLAGLEDRWVRFEGSPRVGFVASVDGVPASAGQVARLDDRRCLLTGGATRPWARHRGCYTALVLARWATMRALGNEAFVVQASAMSAPALAKLGFRPTAELTILLDRLAGA